MLPQISELFFSSSFIQTLDIVYGNCFTFNSGLNSSIRKVSKSGPHFGLTLTVFVGQSQYIGALSPTPGIKLAVHRQDHVPHMEDAMEIGVGQKVAVKIRAVSCCNVTFFSLG